MQGLDVEPNPLAENWAEDKELEIIYQDDAMVVVNKPRAYFQCLVKLSRTLLIRAYKRCTLMWKGRL